MIKKTLKNLFSSKIDLDRIKLENDLDSLFIRFGSDKGSLDGKKTFSYFSRLKKNNSNFVFKNYKNREVYTLIDQKPFFESSILSKSFLDQVFDTLEFSKPYFSDHPWSSMIVIKKK
jgi:hypothetical protein